VFKLGKGMTWFWVERSKVDDRIRVRLYSSYGFFTNDPKVFKHGVGMTFGYPRSDMVLGLKG